MNEFIAMVIAKRPDLIVQFMEHLNMTMSAVAISLLIGIPLAIAITKSRILANVILGTTSVMQSIPSIAMLAFMIPFVGIGAKPAIIMVIVYALLPIIKNSYTGIMSIDPKTIEAAEGLGLTKWQQLIKVRLPIASPFIMAGVRISAVTSVGTMTIAAFAGAGGLGWFINLGLSSNDANMVLLGAVPASLLALALDFLLAKVENILTPQGIKPPDQIVKIPRSKRRFQCVTALLICCVLVMMPVGIGVYRQMTKSDKIVGVGAQNFTEALLIGEIYAQLIEGNTDITVERNFNLGATQVMSALENGEINMYVGYTGSMLGNYLNQKPSSDVQEVYERVKTGMYKQYKVVVSEPLGFNNTYVMAGTEETAKKFGIKTLSDVIKKAPHLHLGCTTGFVHLFDCLPKLEAEYNVKFKEISPLEGSLRYQAATSGKVDIIDAFSTDGLLFKEKLVLFTDDIGFFPPYYAVNAVSESTYKEYPELKGLLAKLDNAFTEGEMGRLNFRIDVNGEDIRTVAHDWLVKKGLVSK